MGFQRWLVEYLVVFRSGRVVNERLLVGVGRVSAPHLTFVLFLNLKHGDVFGGEGWGETLN